MYLVSSCLIGLQSRYDGETGRSRSCLEFLRNSYWIPVCPEQLGGLPTPRRAADIVGGNGYDVLRGTARVIDREGIDVTAQFIRGARQTLYIARSQHIRAILLKSKSPSCSVEMPGVTAALLMEKGIVVKEFTY